MTRVPRAQSADAQVSQCPSTFVLFIYLFIYYLESEACASGAVCRCPNESVSKYIGAVKSSHYILTFQNLSGLREQKSEAIEKICQLIAEVTV